MKKKFVMIFVMILFSLSLLGGGTYLICNNFVTETPGNSGGGIWKILKMKLI